MTRASDEALLARVMQAVREHVVAGLGSNASCTISRCRSTGSSSSGEKVRIVVFVDWALLLTIFHLRDRLRCGWAGEDIEEGCCIPCLVDDMLAWYV
jgi:hypothetical protein